eukprot:8755319-Karenia_brevis.AAC.1
MNKPAAGHHLCEMHGAPGGLVGEQARRARVPGDRLAGHQTLRKWCACRRRGGWAPCNTTRTTKRGQACADDIG